MKKHTHISFQTVFEVLVRLFFFLVFPALFSTAFTGIKMIVEQIATLSPLEWNSFVMTLVVLVAFTIVFGRFFCGFACAFGSYGDFVYFLSSQVQKKRKKKPLRVFRNHSGALRFLKFVVLAVVLLLVIFGMSSLVSLHSPFSAFSRLHALRAPESAIGLLLFLGITVGMALEPRFFCRFLCPMGAVFSLLPVLPFSVIKRDRDRCIPNCKACKTVCPAALDLPSKAEGDNAASGECFACGKCIGRCPAENAGPSCGKRGWLAGQVVKSAVLIALFLLLY